MDRGQRNLVGPSGPPKKWPTLTMDPVLAGITKKWPFFAFCRKAENGPKICLFFLKPKSAKGLIFIWEKGTFFSAQSLLEHGVHWEVYFFSPKIRLSAQKPVLLPGFRQGPVCSLRRYLLFETFRLIFKLFLPELRSFSWGEPGRHAKNPAQGTPSASNSPSTLSAPLHTGWIIWIPTLRSRVGSKPQVHHLLHICQPHSSHPR